MVGPAQTSDDLDDDPRLAAALRAGAAGRRLVNALIASGAPAEVLDAAAADLDRLAETLEPFAVQSRYAGTDGLSVIKFRDPAVAAHHPLLGNANPIAPPLVVEQHDDGWVTVTGTYDKRAEGMPGLVHGGLLAMAFDLALGVASAAVFARPAMTGTLTLKYRAPTPLWQDVVYRAHAEPRSERTVHAVGTLHVGDTLRVEAEGIWVSLQRDLVPPVEVGE
ncbi:MAG: PaaI family thioesterase [Acidimicrobiia bacterium]